MKIGFIGLGIMGSRMAANLVKRGFEVQVHNRSKEKAKTLLEAGATWAESPQDLGENVDIVITMLTKPEVVEAIAFGEKGFMKQLAKGKIWIDCSTINPSFAQEMATRSKQAGIHYLEAPVAGTKGPAEKGELVFFVGGESAILGKVESFLACMGKKTIHAGGAGKGAAIKMAVNLMLGANMLAFTEAVKLGIGLGVSEETMHKILLNTPVVAPFLGLIQEKLRTKNTEANFPLQWMQKDLGLAVKTAQEIELNLPITQTGANTFAKGINKGAGEEDFSSIYHLLEQL